jgi:hypothetical protein
MINEQLTGYAVPGNGHISICGPTLEFPAFIEENDEIPQT